MAELCQIPLAITNKLDARSLVKVTGAADAPRPHAVLCLRFEEQWAVREGPWKRMHNPKVHSPSPKVILVDDRWFLANIPADPGEQTHLAASYPELVERLIKLHESASEKNPPVLEDEVG